MSEPVIKSVDSGICRIELNRPEKLNAMNKEMQAELARALLDADLDDQAEVIVLAGRGKGFCAGGDIDPGDGDEIQFRHRGERVHTGGKRLVQAFLSVEKPLIAEVRGPAAGIGATIALLCDIVIAGESAKIGDRHVNVGLTAGDGGAIVWPLLIGPARAKEYLMTGRFLSGEEAAGIGLVNHCVPDDELSDRVEAMARELADLPSYAVRSTKVAVNRYLEWMSSLTLDTSLAFEHLSMGTEDHAQAVEAWAARRKRAG